MILIGQTAAFLLYKHAINKPSGKFCCGWVKYKLTHVETQAYNALASGLTFLVLWTPCETAGLH